MSAAQSQPPKAPGAEFPLSAREALFAGWLGTLLVILSFRLRILDLVDQRAWLAVAAYQDVLAMTLVGWGWWIVLGVCEKHRLALRWMLGVAWFSYLFMALYSLGNTWLLRDLGSTLTYRILFASNQTTGTAASIRQKCSLLHLIQVLAILSAIGGIGYGLNRLAPAWTRVTARWFHSIRGLTWIGVYIVLGALIAPRIILYGPLVVNPELGFIVSCFQSQQVRIAVPFPKTFLSDFQPKGQRPSELHQTALNQVANVPYGGRPLNVVMLVLESVGVRDLQDNFGNKPSSLSNLGREAAVFNRIYTSQARTSAAMGVLFCSVYPRLSWHSETYESPEFPIPSLANVLGSRGYHTAIVTSPPNVNYDGHDVFLEKHGFNEIRAPRSELTTPIDKVLFDDTIDWIKAQGSNPFFVVLWTNDSHHPYLDKGAARGSSYLEAARYRYVSVLNRLDGLVGGFMEQLDRLPIARDTLVVITGDHGEAFGQHFNWGHGLTVYDEEVHVPLMLINKRLFPKATTSDEIGQAIDIAPTVLALLGYEEPPQWQGTSLFATNRMNRAYLFASLGFLTFGLIEGDLKYMYDTENKRTALYNLTTDPGERDNVADAPRYRGMVVEARQRLAAWLAFQTDYLKPLESPAGSLGERKAQAKSVESDP